MESTKERTARLLGMDKAVLIMHVQDLTKQRDDLVAALKVLRGNSCGDYADEIIAEALVSVEKEMNYRYEKRSGMGLRFDILGSKGLFCICWKEKDARFIVDALNEFGEVLK